MPLAIEHFPDNPAERQYCFVWTRARDGHRVRFQCCTQEEADRSFEHYRARAEIADAHNSETM